MTYIQNHRRNIMNIACFTNKLNKSYNSITISRSLFVEHKHKFVYCEVPKVGCSNWKRILILMEKGVYQNPQELDYDIHQDRSLHSLDAYPMHLQMEILKNYTKVMFSRHPFQRLVSAYRDKIFHAREYYKSVVMSIKKKIRKPQNYDSDLTFEEFVRYLLQVDPKQMDIHWRPMHHICDPCTIQYDIYGKFETMKPDADHVLRFIGAPHYLKFPKMKVYPNESRINEVISKEYFKNLTKQQIQGLAQIYSLDFALFDYDNVYTIN
ncbi:carbohydrate sulfotransferase 8-like [Anomaloglossus baeobatrachus]|uniref:carbohydrate sulfotransferase 8-like n=1 Tax=Anomaloglossus baeobatrachus TaxID=238106 RepID=UPI003F4FFD7D